MSSTTPKISKQMNKTFFCIYSSTETKVTQQNPSSHFVQIEVLSFSSFNTLKEKPFQKLQSAKNSKLNTAALIIMRLLRAREKKRFYISWAVLIYQEVGNRVYSSYLKLKLQMDTVLRAFSFGGLFFFFPPEFIG